MMRFVKCYFLFMDGKLKMRRRVPAPVSLSPCSLGVTEGAGAESTAKPQQPPPGRRRMEQRVLFSVVRHGIIFYSS